MNEVIKQCFSGVLTIKDMIKALKPYDRKEEVPVEHFYGDNLLCRQAKYPKGMLIIGRVHKFNHVFMVISGKITVWSDGERKLLVGPCVFESKAGVQRIGYVHSDVVCMNMHGLQDGVSVDLDTVEEMMTVEDGEAYDRYTRTLGLDAHGNFIEGGPSGAKWLRPVDAPQVQRG